MRHNPTAQVVNIHDKHFLVDCGEGTQMQLRRYKVKMQRLHHVFISHLHGDHFFGFNGLISTMHLLGRTKPLHVHAPEGLKLLFEAQQAIGEMHLDFQLIFHDNRCESLRLLYDDNTLEVWGFPLEHRIQCTGFLFKEKRRKANISRHAIKEHQLTVSEILALKNGNDVCRTDGTILKAEELTEMAPVGRSYAFCSDTRYSEKVIQAIEGVDLLYHEATFLEDMKLRALQTHHSTAKDAATVALKAKVGALVLGHFSARYTDESPLLIEAMEVFPKVSLAKEGMVFVPRGEAFVPEL
jgi:ribonuclease Z